MRGSRAEAKQAWDFQSLQAEAQGSVDTREGQRHDPTVRMPLGQPPVRQVGEAEGYLQEDADPENDGLGFRV